MYVRHLHNSLACVIIRIIYLFIYTAMGSGSQLQLPTLPFILNVSFLLSYTFVRRIFLLLLLLPPPSNCIHSLHMTAALNSY